MIRIDAVFPNFPCGGYRTYGSKESLQKWKDFGFDFKCYGLGHRGLDRFNIRYKNQFVKTYFVTIAEQDCNKLDLDAILNECLKTYAWMF
jgi:hypothetical protein